MMSTALSPGEYGSSGGVGTLLSAKNLRFVIAEYGWALQGWNGHCGVCQILGQLLRSFSY